MPSKRSKTTGNLLRYAEFECPICQSHFVSMIEKVALDKVKSCGAHMSLGESTIKNILQKLNLEFIEQKTFPNLGHQSKLKNRFFYYPFDFYISKNNLCIEYDGIQHFSYKETDNSWNNKENFLLTRQRDEIKNTYCLNHNIPLIRIPYTEYDKINQQYLQDIIENYKEYDYNKTEKRGLYREICTN